jgi:hypothetical protein
VVSSSGEGVDREREADEVEVLAFVADAVRASEPEAVVESAVDALGVVAAPVEAGEVGVVGGDGSNVFGAIELASNVFVGAVQSEGDDACAALVGELVVVVPTILAGLVAVAVRADAPQCGEVEVAGVGERADPERVRADYSSGAP